jgi:hypothetical protein
MPRQGQQVTYYQTGCSFPFLKPNGHEAFNKARSSTAKLKALPLKQKPHHQPRTKVLLMLHIFFLSLGRSFDVSRKYDILFTDEEA